MNMNRYLLIIAQVILMVSPPVIESLPSKYSGNPSLMDHNSSSLETDDIRFNYDVQSQMRRTIANLQPPPLISPITSTAGMQNMGEQVTSDNQPSTSNLPDLNAFQSEEETSSAEDVKPNVDELQTELQKFKAKQERRRAQNRKAAQRSRQRKKDEGDYLTKKTQALNTANTHLKYEIECLTKERDDLKLYLEEHLKVCPMGASLVPPVSALSLDGSVSGAAGPAPTNPIPVHTNSASNIVIPQSQGGDSSGLDTAAIFSHLEELQDIQSLTAQPHAGQAQTQTITAESQSDIQAEAVVTVATQGLNLNLGSNSYNQQQAQSVQLNESNLQGLHQNLPLVIPGLQNSMILPGTTRGS